MDQWPTSTFQVVVVAVAVAGDSDSDKQLKKHHRNNQANVVRPPTNKSCDTMWQRNWHGKCDANWTLIMPRTDARPVMVITLDNRNIGTGGRTQMEIDIQKLIESLSVDRLSEDHPQVPDGLIDLSFLVNPMVHIMSNGRALNSEHAYDHARFFGCLLASMIPPNPSPAELCNAIATLTLFIAQLLEVAVHFHEDTTSEELLMIAFSPDSLRKMRDVLSAVPYIKSDGSIRPNFASLPQLSSSRRMTKKIKDGFAARHWLPHLTDMIAAPESEAESAHPERVYQDDLLPIEFIAIDDFDDLEADPLDGFDDFFDHFYENFYTPFMEGAELDDLLAINHDNEPEDVDDQNDQY